MILSLRNIGFDFGEEVTSRLKSNSQIALWTAFLTLLLLSMPALSAPAHDFAGTVQRVSEPSELFVKITETQIQGLGNSTDVILKQPLPDLSYLRGKKLQFDVMGHDILGRPVCDAYIDGRSVQDAYYCMKYPDYCELYGSDFRNELIGYDFYNPCYNGYCSDYYPAGCHSCSAR